MSVWAAGALAEGSWAAGAWSEAAEPSDDVTFFTVDSLGLEPDEPDGTGGRFYQDNPNAVRVRGLRDVTGTLVAGASLSAALYRAGVQIWSGALEDVEGTVGDYRGWIPHTVEVTLKEVLVLTVTATDPDSHGEWDQKVRVFRRAA